MKSENEDFLKRKKKEGLSVLHIHRRQIKRPTRVKLADNVYLYRKAGESVWRLVNQYPENTLHFYYSESSDYIKESIHIHHTEIINAHTTDPKDFYFRVWWGKDGSYYKTYHARRIAYKKYDPTVNREPFNDYPVYDYISEVTVVPISAGFNSTRCPGYCEIRDDSYVSKHMLINHADMVFHEPPPSTIMEGKHHSYYEVKFSIPTNRDLPPVYAHYSVRWVPSMHPWARYFNEFDLNGDDYTLFFDDWGLLHLDVRGKVRITTKSLRVTLTRNYIVDETIELTRGGYIISVLNFEPVNPVYK